TIGTAVYVVGGLNNGVQSRRETQQYTEATCGTATATPIGTPLSATPTPVPPICGSGAWAPDAPYPIPAMGAATVVHNGVLYSFGGWANEAIVADSYRYDSGMWTPLAPLPEARWLASAVSDGTYIYIVNGTNLLSRSQSTLYRYDPQTDSYTTVATSPTATNAQAAVYLDGKIYRIGGYLSAGGTNSVDVYTVASNTWAAGPAYPFPVQGPAAVAWGGYIYTAGGWIAPGPGKAYRFDPATSLWDDAAVADLPNQLEVPAAGVLNGRWILAGGLTNRLPNTVTNTVSMLDLSAPAAPWTQLTSLPATRSAAVAGTLGSTFYVVGGADATFTSHQEGYGYSEGLCPTSTPTRTATALPTATQPPATSTALPSPSATRTSAPPTVTAVPATSTAAPASATYPPATSTAAPASPSASRTSVPPSATQPWLPSATATAPLGSGTSTAVPPSATRPPPTGTPAPPSATATLCPVTFSDVHPADYFYGPVQYLACHNVISGYSDGTFRPYANTTRGQVVKIIVAGFGLPISTPPGGGYSFADVLPGSAFFPFVETAAGQGLISGYGCGGPGEPCDPSNRAYLRPGLNVTRGQLAKIVALAGDWAPGNPPVGTFADVAPGSVFYGYIEAAVCRGIISGYTCGGPSEPCDPQNRPYFRQGASATRGQIAKIVYLGLGAGGGCAVR
ncbi:MAG TPA: S-layer homology domain-containing protein, partial [Chloroflexia bacterium]|nr:S-layer homology domain-containing protein [Chloroflexia bacterium]